MGDFAIIVDPEPRSPIARQFHAGVRVAEHRMTDRPAASVRINKKQASQVLTSDIGASRAIADRADVHTRRSIEVVDAHDFIVAASYFLEPFVYKDDAKSPFRENPKTG